MSYLIAIKTGDMDHAGALVTVKLKIIGSNGESKTHELEHSMSKDFKQGAVDNYTLKDDTDIGDIECISLLVKSIVIDSDSWYIDYISIVTDPPLGKAIIFPFYQWITKREYGKTVIIATNKTCIPQKECEERKKNNRRESQTKKAFLNWRKCEEGFPNIIDVYGGHKNLPDLNLKFSDKKSTHFEQSLKKVKNNGIFLGILSRLKSFESFDDFKQFSRDLKNYPAWVMDDRWRKDEEFGRQILNGINPGHVRRCKKLPENFLVTNSDVTGLLTRGKSLEEEMDSGFIYIINHSILQDVTTGHYDITKDRKTQLAVPMCLFYVRDDNEFVPIAIQLGQVPGPNFPIWTPKDAPLDWLLAKIWFRNADMQVHQMTSHLAYTHFTIEIFALAMHRCLPPVHPVHKLLREHLQFVIAINTLGRELLVQPVKIIERYPNSFVNFINYKSTKKPLSMFSFQIRNILIFSREVQQILL